MKQGPTYNSVGGRGGGNFETPSNHLWVGNLPPDTSDSYLADLFGKYGLLDGITSYASRGYSFVYFKSVEDAAAAKNALQGFMVRGNSLKIQFPKLAKPSKQVWVGGFSSSLTKEKLENELSKFGKIEEFRFVRERNTALVHFVRLEDATAAVKNLNGFLIGGDRLRVDFLRSHPVRRDQPDFPDLGSTQFRGVGAVDLSWNNQDTRSFPDPPYLGHKRPQTPQSSGGRKENPPSKVLWVGYPSSVVIDEEMLHNAMILFGEIERVTCYRGRHYSFVEFRSVDEARRAKEALQGRLFNDPRITIMYSYSDQAPGKDFGPPYPSFGGQKADMFGNDLPFRPPLMDMFAPNRGMAPNSFHGSLPPGAMLGPGVPRPLEPRESFDPLLPPSDFNDPTTTHSSMPDLAANVSLGFNQRKLSPPARGLLPTPGRTSQKTTGWDVVDPNQPLRTLKRPRVDDQTSCPSPILGKRNEYASGVDQPYGGGGSQTSGGPLPRVLADSGSSPTPDMRVAKGNVARPNEDCVWRGVIAKGGTPVCNARCIAIGKGLECELPEAVNCSARTGLDMLKKHYASSIGFDIVFFLPDSEEDFANYTEFLRYLGSKNRAGVAKLDDGTTLFLVPPSDFLTDVLKVPSRERLYGVVLRLPQQVSQPFPPPVAQMDRQLLPPTHEYVTPKEEQVPVRMDYPRVTPNETLPQKSLLTTGSLSQEQSGVKLTPELIATLASLLPKNSQPSAPQITSQPPQLSSSSTVFSQRAFSQGWNGQQQLQVVDQTEQQSHQQFNSQTYLLPQMSTTSQPISSNYNQANMAMQNPVHYNNQATPYSNQQYVPSSQPYNFEAPHNSQKGYGMVYGENQQQPNNNNDNNNSGQYTFYGGNSSVSENVLPSSSGNVNMNVEPQNPNERSQQVPAGGSQSQSQSTEVEVVKNQRYQTTLQFAADLLLQIQQRQQQQQQASSHMGNQQ